MLYLDTHAVIWLYAGDLSLFSKKALQVLEKKSLTISATVMLEIQYLYEIKRCTKKPVDILNSLEKEIGLTVCQRTFNDVVEKSLAIHWTRDPFDRLIISNAMLEQQPLLTKDTKILNHYKHAIW